MADEKNILTPSAGVVVGGSTESSISNTPVEETKDTIKEDKTTNATSKEVKPNKADSTTVKANSDTTVETFKIQEIVGDKIVIGFHGYRIALPNKSKRLGDSIELEYGGSRQNFNIIDYK